VPDEAGDAAADVTSERSAYDAPSPPRAPRTPVSAEFVSNRVDTQSLLFAAGEMQISGEPFVQNFAGRNLNGYDRNYVPPDQYLLRNGDDDPVPMTDLFGFSCAVESYEYSKYHMNMVLQQTTAGVSLADGPVVAAEPGTTSLDRLRARAGALLAAAGTDVGAYATLPAPAGNALNYLGFPGLWPVMAPYESFDPAMDPSQAIVQACTLKGGYGGVGYGAASLPVYECSYNTLQLPHRDAQVDKTLVPAVLGFAAWKEALWAIDFAGRLHDSASNAVTAVAAGDLAAVGQQGNAVIATDPPGAAKGTYIGSSPLEGMWGLVMLASMDNLAQWEVSSLMTADGRALSGFASISDALAYDYGSPLAWFPAATTATEDPSVPYPAVASLAIADATSRSIDLAALLLGNALFFGMTDARNAGIGQRQGLLATFDGDPFPADDGVPDGEATAHDRALAVLRVAFVDLDRLHVDPTLGVVVDTVVPGPGAGIARSSAVTTATLAHVVIALRQTLLSLNGSITQYGAPDPDPAADQMGALNSLPFHPAAGPAGAGQAPNFSQRVRQLFVSNASFVRDVLTRPDGTVANSAVVVQGGALPLPGAATLESQAAAARALTEGFLMTGDETFRDRARKVITRLEADFYAPRARMYRQQAAGADQIHMTPERFGWLQSALRETYKVLHVPGDAVMDRAVLEDRIARINKLFLNGWDDLDGNQVVDKPGECLGARLQMAEQALTGELGRDGVARASDDRDGDCVLELSHAKTASALASDVFFHAP
jgi:hypothetical protein